MNLIYYLLYSCIIIAITTLAGFCITNRFKSLNILEKISVNFGFSILLIVVLTPLFAFKFNLFAQILLIGMLCISIRYLFLERSSFKMDKEIWLLMGVFLVGLFSKFFVQIFIEYPVMGGDWFSHAFIAPFGFEGSNWTPPRDRTPLFSILIYSLHNLLHTSLYQYWISQIISVVLNSLYIFPAYLIAKKVFGNWVAKISILFMLITPFLIYNTIYTWPKNAAMYGILMMIYFLFFSEQSIKLRYPLAGFFAGLGFLFHNYAVFYAIIAFFLLMHKDGICNIFSKDFFVKVKRLFYFAGTLLIVLIPYFAWVYAYYGTISTSKFIYYPIAVNGYNSALNKSSKELWNIFRSTPLQEIIWPRISNALATLTPAALPINPIATSRPHYNLIFYYSHDYPGALSTLMYILVIVWFVRLLLKKSRTDVVFLNVIFMPWIVISILFAWQEWGMVGAMLHPTVPLLIMIVFNELKKWTSNFKNFFIYILFFFAMIEDAIYGSLIRKFYLIEGGLEQIAKTGGQVVADFDISKFISAYFFLNMNIDIWFSILIFAVIAVLFLRILYNTNQELSKE